MLNLFDYLTPLDNKRIENYISLYGVQKDDYIGNEKYLKYWAANKKHLFHLLGGNLIYKFPIRFTRPRKQLLQEFESLHPFISLFYDKINDRDFYKTQSAATIRDMRALTWSETLAEDAIPDTIKTKRDDKTKMLQLQKGMKPVKAIQKIINYFEWDDLKEPFEDFRIKHSQICNTREMTGNMCISIHPLDFMTMSDNKSGWSSCMTWTGKGCYHAGTVEMMNSNNVVCCYIESADTFYFNKNNDSDEFIWNNKKWRQLFYVTKEIAVCGKAYPYQYKEFTITALDKIKELSEKNLHRSYQFGVEPYRDMNHIGSYFRMKQNKEWIHNRQTTKHNIIFDSKGMYNDMFNDHDGDEDIYWCYRNKVKKNTIICYSGKAPCLCCGKSVVREAELDSYNYDGKYNDRYDNTGDVICEDCKDKYRCDFCDASNPTGKIHFLKGEKYCNNCYQQYAKICPSCGDTFMDDSSPIDKLWGRISDIQLYQQDFFSVQKYRPGVTKIIPLKMCKPCNERMRETKFIRIKPPYDKDRTYYSWITEKEYYVSKDLIDGNSVEWSKYYDENLLSPKET